MAAQASFIPIEEYLRTSYRPDVEYIDGYLEEKPLGTWEHGRLQWLIAGWFLRHEAAWGVQGSLEVRTRVATHAYACPILSSTGPARIRLYSTSHPCW